MKRILILVFTLTVTLSMFNCKKGDNDPFISLLSRKARLAGTWKVDSYEKLASNVDGDEKIEVEEVFNGLTVFKVTTTVDEGTTSIVEDPDDVTISDYNFVIEKDGNWSSSLTRLTVSEIYIADDTLIINTKEQFEMTGTWSFIGKNKGNYKNKERVQFSVLNHTSTSDFEGGDREIVVREFNQNEFVLLYDIDRLKNKEMVWKLDAHSTLNITNIDGMTGLTGEYDGGTISYTEEIKLVQ
ncbi:hypothetical protein [Crocinitomix catalasitica]|uniref:hypothetical protein n=1 Tax=Crocinitomix catalasitica TaxID=184607 RepID=UPI0012FC5B92|nr:hypothetical protein [Crocinitomix catalasitica]